MASRLRGPSSLKERSNMGAYDEPEERAFKPYKSDAREKRYHFGMTKHEEQPVRNGRECKDESVGTTSEDPDLLYRRSREHFGAWNIKDIVHEPGSRAKKQDDRPDPISLTNGKSKTDVARQDNVRQESREDAHPVASPKEQHSLLDTIDRELGGSHRSRKRERWDSQLDSKVSKPTRVSSKSNGKREEGDQRVDERDLLLREIESLTVDGRSPDRRIRAMIERFKTREEGKLRSRREHGSTSPEKQERRGRSKSGGRNDARVPSDLSVEGRTNDRVDRGRVSREDREDERRYARSRTRERYDGNEEPPRDTNGSRSVDRRSRSTEKFNDNNTLEKEDDSKRTDSFRRKNDTYSVEKSYRRKSREMEDEQQRPRDSSKRRSYAYEGSPEDFDVRIQRYERAQPESRKDAEPSKRSSSRDVDHDLSRKDSLKEHDRQPTRKNSFKAIDPPKKSATRDRESSLSRKASFKEQEDTVHRKNSFKSPTDASARYFGKDQETDIHRRSSLKDQSAEPPRRNPFKEQTAEYGRIAFKNQDHVVERKNSLKGPNAGGSVSRITFKDHENELARANAYKDPDVEVGRVTFKDHANDLGRRNSPKEKTVEFGGISFKELDDVPATRDPYEDRENELGKVSFREYDGPERKLSPNGRYVEFGKVSFKDQEDDTQGAAFKDHDVEVGRKSSFKDRDSSRRRTSLRSRAREALEKRSDRHSRALTPPKHGELEIREDSKAREDSKCREEFSTKSWHESNRTFSAKYLRENARVRTTPEGRSEIEREFLPETNLSIQEFRDVRKAEGYHEDAEDDKEEGPRRETMPSIDSTGMNSAREHDARYASTHERNGATIIRIRSSPEDSIERRRRRRPGQDAHGGRRGRRQEAEDEESDEENEGEDQRQRARRDAFGGAPTPSRRIWNYREGGVHITDFEEGQPCLECGETCPGFSPHSWRKNCTSCKCPREAHDVFHEEWVSVRSRLGLKGEESSGPIGFDPREKGLAWVPPGLPAHKVEEYFSMLPEISVPRLGTPGERHRDRQLAIQLPKQDLARAYCRHLNPMHASSADDFMAARNEIALDIGSVQEVLERNLNCGVCDTPLKYGSLAVSASKLGLLCHPSCFRCSACNELLVDLAYCVHDDTLFCERHYAEKLKARCAACDELIFSGEYTKAMNKDWHSGHFCCWQCDESLTGQRYVLRDEHPYCIKCYESVFANGCEECSKIIGIDSKDLSYKDKHWHEACFLCNRCRVSLVDKQFGSKVDKIYCGNCYDAQFASRCDGCGEIFRAGTKKMEYKTRQWHEKCFCCVVCKNPIGTKSFIPREQEIYCAGCYEDKFATRCVKCNKIITSGGVTYKNEPWHRDCFTCSNCNNSLAGQRFTSRDEKPYCADCFGELFAKRCTACSKPITGIGGTRFISFEDRHWHNDCFICAGCKTSLVGRGFITDGEDIICPECAKMKLM